MSTIVFDGVEYDRDVLPEALINYIETYIRAKENPSQKTPDDTDYDFRMTQAMQMFGEPEVISSINELIDEN